MPPKTSLLPSLDISLPADGFSNADPQELRRNAEMDTVKEFIRSSEGIKWTLAKFGDHFVDFLNLWSWWNASQSFTLRPLTMGDSLYHYNASFPLLRAHGPVPRAAERGDPY